MRSSVPDGDLATILDQAVTEKLEKLEAKRFGKTKTPRKTLTSPTRLPRRDTSRLRSSERFTSAINGSALS